MPEAMTIQEQCKLTLPRFEETAGKVPWCPRSILMSEGLAVCAMADLHGIDLLIESGVCNGRSTEMWCRYLPEATRIKAIDWNIPTETHNRLKAYMFPQTMDQRLILFLANAERCVPEMIANAASLRIGIFIDGPKDDAAVKLARECIAHKNVQFVGVHDLALHQAWRPHEARYNFAMQNRVDGDDPIWFTDAEWFVELSHHLDADESHLDVEQGTRWTPYCRHDIGKAPVPLGSYGYTIGFLSKDVQE